MPASVVLDASAAGAPKERTGATAGAAPALGAVVAAAVFVAAGAPNNGFAAAVAVAAAAARYVRCMSKAL